MLISRFLGFFGFILGKIHILLGINYEVQGCGVSRFLGFLGNKGFRTQTF
jgi:hypothetical protein